MARCSASLTCESARNVGDAFLSSGKSSFEEEVLVKSCKTASASLEALAIRPLEVGSWSIFNPHWWSRVVHQKVSQGRNQSPASHLLVGVLGHPPYAPEVDPLYARFFRAKGTEEEEEILEVKMTNVMRNRVWSHPYPPPFFLASASGQGSSGMRAAVIAVQVMPKRETLGVATKRAPKVGRWNSACSGFPRVQDSSGWL